jgi:hypothetical protein
LILSQLIPIFFTGLTKARRKLTSNGLGGSQQVFVNHPVFFGRKILAQPRKTVSVRNNRLNKSSSKPLVLKFLGISGNAAVRRIPNQYLKQTEISQ